ncbi:MAG: hypothetical protein Q9211_007025 [Gyalolechia sp. 1 TL-2023]
MSIAARFTRAVTGTTKHHIYVSRSHDVATNLSIEHYLLQKSHPDSTVLLLYVNRPCIVIGRNQNPWLEVNHALVRRTVAPSSFSAQPDQGSTSFKEKIKIIRRRSGGGTVFHDLGNVNFSVIGPPANFHRDKYAEMVVRAIRETSPRARVNERHDIVLDPGPLLDRRDQPQPDDTHKTAFSFGGGSLVPRKVSGSAYKLTRQRALHHGTCLLSSPNISSISAYLQSPARPYLKAKGVESVRSPIANIIDGSKDATTLTTSTFQRQIINAFAEMYDLKTIKASAFSDKSPSWTEMDSGSRCAFGMVDEDLLEIPDIAKGVQEIEARVYLKIKSGVIISSKISLSEHPDAASSEQTAFDHALKGNKVANIRTFWEIFGTVSTTGLEDDTRRISAWLDLMLGKESDFAPI